MFNVRRLIASYWLAASSPSSRSLYNKTTVNLLTKGRVNFCNYSRQYNPINRSARTTRDGYSSQSPSSSSSSSSSKHTSGQFQREAQYRAIESSMMNERKVTWFRLQRFLDEIKSSPSIKSSESLMLIRACGGHLFEAKKEDRNKLIDEVWSLLEAKSAPLDISHYNALLNVYIDNDYAADPSKFLDMLQNRGIQPNRVTYHRLLHLYCQQGNLQGAQDILLKMKANNMPVHEGVFNSLILGNMKAGSIEAGENILTIMKNSQVDPTSETYTTLLKSYALHLDKEGIPEKMSKLLRDLESQDVFLPFDSYMDIIEAIADQDDKSPLIDEILAMVPRGAGYSAACSRLVTKVAYKNQTDLGLKLLFSLMRSDLGDPFKTSGSFFIYHLVRGKTEFDEVMRACQSLESSGHNNWSYWKATEAALYCEQDTELVRKYLKTFQAKTGLVRIHFVWPLLCRMKTSEEVLQVLREEIVPFKSSFGDGALAETFRNYVWPRITENQSDFLAKCRELGFDNDLIMATIADNAQRGQGAITMSDILSERPLPRNITERDVYRLFQDVASTLTDGLLAKELLDLTLKKTKLPVTPRLLLPIYTAIVQKCDKDKALEEWLECVRIYGQTPCKSIIMQKLIEADDAENLQKVTDVCMQQVGERSTLISLVLAFLRTKKDKQAKKILSRPPFQRFELGIMRILDMLHRQNETEALERLIAISKDIPGIDRERLYYTLLDSFIQNGQAQKALEMWTQIQEENLIPSARIMTKLSRFLKDQGMEVPFKYQDEIEEGKQTVHHEDAQTVRDQFHASLRNGDLDTALSMTKQMNREDPALTLGDICNLIDKLIRADRLTQAVNLTNSMMANGRYPSPRIYKALLENMAQVGRFKQIDDMIESLPAALKETYWFSQTVISAHTHSRNSDIHTLVKVLPSLNPLPYAGILEFLDINPQFERQIFDCLEKLASSRETNLPMNIIWLRLMKSGRFDEATKVFHSSPDFKDTLMIKPLLYEIKRNKNLMLGEHLVDQLNETELNAKVKGLAYDAFIYALLEKNKTKEAQDVLQKGLEANKDKQNPLTMSDINHDIIVRLYHSIRESLDQEPFFEIPEKTISFKSTSSSSRRFNGSSSPTDEQDRNQSVSKI